MAIWDVLLDEGIGLGYGYCVLFQIYWVNNSEGSLLNFCCTLINGDNVGGRVIHDLDFRQCIG